MKPVFNNTKDTLYFIEANLNGGTTNNGIYRMSIYDNTPPAVPLIQAIQNQYFYALGIEPSTGNIYVGDPKGTVQKGTVYIYKSNGSLIKSFSVGEWPGHFYFDEWTDKFSGVYSSLCCQTQTCINTDVGLYFH